MANNNETTTKFKVDISELKKAMQEAKRQISVANSEFKAVSSSMDNWAKSTTGLQAKLKQLDSNLNSQKTILKNLESQYEAVVREQGAGSAAADKLKVAINNQKATVNQTEKQIKTYGEALRTAEKAEEIAARTGRDAAEVFDELADNAEGAGKKAEKSSSGFTVMKGALANLVADGIRVAISALKDFSKEAIQVGMDFEASMSEVAAISGATGDQLKLLEKTAKEYGATTVFSASEAAQALKYMALAGWDAETATSALGGVLDLAAASGMELARASDMVTDYLSAFGLAADKSTYFADMLAYAQSNSNTSAEQLGEAYKNSAANMKAAGQDVETTTALLAQMANQGFKGSEAGTALTAMMRDLTAKMKDGKIAIGKTAVTVKDANGNYRDMTDILKDVEKATKGMGDAERATALSATFTADSTKGLNLLLNAGVDEAAKFEKALRGAGGTAKNMGNIMNDNAQGDIKAFESALEGVRIEVYDELQPSIRDFVKYLTKDGIKILKDVAKSSTDLAKRAIPYVKKAVEALAKVVKFGADNFETLVAVLFTAVTVFKLLKAAMAIANTVKAFTVATTAATTAVGLATKAQMLWNAAMSANVIGAVIAALGLLTVGIVALVGSNKEAAAATDVLSESQRESVNAAKSAAEAYQETKNSATEMANAELANITYTQQLYGELKNLVDANGKVKEGYEGRVNFILNELNKALGTEYTMTGNVINQYGEMKKSINEVIEAKKAQILLSAYEESYANAIKNVTAAEQARATQAQELSKLTDQLVSDEERVKTAREHLTEVTKWGSAAQINAAPANLRSIQEEYDKTKKALSDKTTEFTNSSKNVKQYYSDIDSYEKASTLILQGETKKAVDVLKNYGNGFENVASTAEESKNKQYEILKQQVIDTQVNLKLMEDEYKRRSRNMTEEEKAQAKKRIENAREQADEAATEFKKVGGNITKGIAKGAENEDWTLSNTMSNLVNSAVKAAKKAAGIKSPSRLFKKEVGKFLGLGIAAGIDDSTKDVIKSVKGQISDIKNAYDLNSLASVPDGLGVGSSGVINNFYQTNNSPKALSRLEIYRQSKNLLGYAGGIN